MADSAGTAHDGQAAARAPESEIDRCISQGIDILDWSNCPNAKLLVNNTVSYLKRNTLSLLAVDKEEGFAILVTHLYESKASEAVLSVFHKCPDVSLQKVKTNAMKLCHQFKLEALKKTLVQAAN